MNKTPEEVRDALMEDIPTLNPIDCMFESFVKTLEIANLHPVVRNKMRIIFFCGADSLLQLQKSCTDEGKPAHYAALMTQVDSEIKTFFATLK